MAADDSGNARWRYVDKDGNDDVVSRWPPYERLYLNFNGSMILAPQPFNSSQIDVFKPGDVRSTFTPLDATSSNTEFIPHSKMDLFFHCQLYDQFFTNLNSRIGYMSYIDSRFFNGNFDLSNRENEDLIVYLLADGYFKVLDYGNQNTIQTTDAFSFNKMKVSLDGSAVIATTANSDASSTIYIFNTDYLRRTNRAKGTGRKSPGKEWAPAK